MDKNKRGVTLGITDIVVKKLKENWFDYLMAFLIALILKFILIFSLDFLSEQKTGTESLISNIGRADYEQLNPGSERNPDTERENADISIGLITLESYNEIYLIVVLEFTVNIPKYLKYSLYG